MDIGRHLASRISGAGLLAATATLAISGVAIASNATKGGSYVGTYAGASNTDSITFKVSSNGKQVVDLNVITPVKCNGGCGGFGTPITGSAKISKGGTFKVTLKIKAPGTSNQTEGTDKVTGKFLKGGRARGKVTSHFNHGSSGNTVSWTAVS